MIFRTDEWAPIQQRLVEAGYNDVPNGKIKDSFLKGNWVYFIIEFDSEQDEMWFNLRWL